MKVPLIVFEFEPDTEPSLLICCDWLEAVFLLPWIPFSKKVSELVWALLLDCPNWFWLVADEPALDCSLKRSFSRIELVLALELVRARLPFLSKFADWLWAEFLLPEESAVWKLCCMVLAALNCPDDPSVAMFPEVLPAAFWLNVPCWF